MKAAVLYEYNPPLVLDDVELDAPRAEEVLVRIGAAAYAGATIISWWATLGRSSQQSWATKAPA